MSTAAEIEIRERRVVVGRLQRVRRGGREMSAQKALRSSGDPRPARVALMLALALSIQRSIEAGEIQDQAEAARRLGISRARVPQIQDLTLLAPSVQEAVLSMRTVEGAEPVVERTLRDVLKYDAWALQETIWVGPARPTAGKTDRSRGH